MSSVWRAPGDVLDLVLSVKSRHHSPRLDSCTVAVCFDESKPFLKNKINLGKLTKFSNLARLYQREKYDFCLTIPSEVWGSILRDQSQKEAYIDLQLTRCDVEYMPEEIEENNKKKKVVDEFGRVKYTNQPKLDAAGELKWKVQPLDLEVFTQNVRRFGIWLDDLGALRDAIEESSQDN